MSTMGTTGINLGALLERIKANAPGAAQAQATAPSLLSVQAQAPQLNPPGHFSPEYVSPFAQGEFQSSGGRKRAEKAALFQSAAALSKQFGDYLHEQQVRKLSTQFERVFGAVQGLEDAKSLPDSDPRKKELTDTNTKILSDFANDKKSVKALQKAMDVKLIGDDKATKTPEYKAMQQAIKNHTATKEQVAQDAEQKKQMGLALIKKLQESMPKRLGLSPEAQAQGAAVKAGVAPNANTVLQQTEANARTYAKFEQEGKIHAETLEQRKEHDKLLTDLKEAENEARKYASDNTLAGQKARADATVKAANIRASIASKQLALHVADFEARGLATEARALKAYSDSFTKQLSTFQKMRDDELNQRNPNQQTIQFATANILKLQQQMDGINSRILKKISEPGFAGADSSGSSTGTASEETNPTPEELDDSTDDSDILDMSNSN